MTELTQTDQVIFRFLLDQLPAGERESFEGRLFEDPEFFEVVEATEEELILKYVRKELDEPWVSWFEKAYLVNDIRRSRVDQARTLVGVSQRLREPARPSRRAAKAAIAGGLIAASAAGVGIYRSARAPREVIFQLDPEVMRGEGGDAALDAKGAKTVRFELKIPADAAGGRYEAVLGTPEAPGLWAGVVEAGAPAARVPLEIPASGLKRGEYILELRNGQGVVASYQFRVR